MKQKAWYAFIADGKLIGCLEDSAKCKSERKRLGGLCGIKIQAATPGDLMAANAKSILSKSQIDKMQRAESFIRGRKQKKTGSQAE